MSKRFLESVLKLLLCLLISGVDIPESKSKLGQMWPVGLTRSAQAQEDSGDFVIYSDAAGSDSFNISSSEESALYDIALVDILDSVGSPPSFSSSGGSNLSTSVVALNQGGSDLSTSSSGSASSLSDSSGLSQNRGNPRGNGVGDPINIATGDAYEVQTDYTTIGRFPLALVRYYNSLDTGGLHSLGNNWRSSYSRSISVSGSTATVTRDDGMVMTFTSSGGLWAAPVYANFRLTQTASGFTLITDKDETETYNSAGNLLSYANRAGLAQSFAYDGQNRLTSAEDAYGRTLTFSYNSSSLISQATAPDGGVYAYGYDSSNRLTSVTYPDGSKLQYLYENGATSNQLTGVVDENGSRYATYAYASNGRATSTQHAGGADLFTVSNISASGSNGVVTVTTPLGGQHQFTIASIDGLAKQLQDSRSCSNCPAGAGGGSEQFAYDGNGNLTSVTDFNGYQTTFAYDTTRNLPTSRTRAYGASIAQTSTTTWHPTFRLPTQTVNGSRTRNFTYDASGNLLTSTTVTPTTTRTKSYTYNGAGQVLTATDPLGHVTSYAYDSMGDLSSVTNALGQVVSLTNYDASGRPLTIQDPNGIVTALTYNFRGQVLSSVTQGQTTTYSYDRAGQLTQVTSPSGTVSNFSYDAAHRLIGVSDGLGNSIALTLDAAGNRIKSQVFSPSGALARTHSRVYDGYGRLYQDIGAAGQTSTLSYDSNANVVGAQDPNGNSTSVSYDALNRVTQRSDPGHTVLCGFRPCVVAAITSFIYDVNNRVASVTDPRGVVTSYTNNGLGGQTAIASPDAGATANTFDAAGNLLTSTDARGQTTTFVYDALNRLVKATYADGSTATYGYDLGAYGVGHLTSLTDWTGTTSWAYDAFGHVVQKTQTTGAVTLTTSWTYNSSNGLLTSATYPSGYTVLYSYDADARPSTIGLQPPAGSAATLVGQISYSAFGPVASWYAASGAVYARSFDGDGRVAGISLPGGGTQTLAYDAGSRITSIAESGLSTKSFGYDTSDRLTSYVYGSTTQSYAYDLSGNRTSYSATGAGSAAQTFSYAATSNQLSTISGASSQSFAYDPDGNTKSDAASVSSFGFAYDARGRLSSATVGALVTTYGVNALGQRVSKSGPASGQVEYAYDLAGRLVGSYGANGAASEEIVWLGSLPIASLQGGSAYWIAPDHLGAPHQIVNFANSQVWFWDHDPFGVGAPASAAGFTHNLRFPGQYFDAETGLHYNGFRDYSPTLGRYLESDPIGLAGGINTYAYVGNNPLGFVDPLGLSADRVAGAAGAINAMIAAVSGALARPAPVYDWDTGERVGTTTVGAKLAFWSVPAIGTGALLGGEAVLGVGGVGESGALAARAQEIHSALDPIAQAQRTTAILRTSGGDIIAGGTRDLAPAQRALLGPGEIAATLPGAHAEITALSAARAGGLIPETLATTRAICPACAAVIEANGGTLTSPTTATFGP